MEDFALKRIADYMKKQKPAEATKTQNFIQLLFMSLNYHTTIFELDLYNQ